MPYIDTKVSIAITPQQEIKIKEKLGKAIELIPGKSEHWLMLSFTDNCKLYFRGSNNSPIAFVKVICYGKSTKETYNKLTANICNILKEELSIPSDHVYIQYEEAEHFGYNGRNF